MLKERVILVDNYWDMTPISGIAYYQQCVHYFSLVFNEEKDDFIDSDNYQLQRLSPEIFSLCQQNNQQWLSWLTATKYLHPIDYAKQRKHNNFQQISTLYAKQFSQQQLQTQEDYWSREQHINSYLAQQAAFFISAEFSGKIDGTDTWVTWREI